MNEFPEPEDLEIWLYDIAGNRTMLLTEASNVRVETQLQGLEELSFKILRDDPKSDFIIADALVEFEGTFWRVRDYEDEHPTIRTIMCDARWIELSWRTKTGPYSILGKTPSQGVETILAGTSWSLGTGPLDFDLYSAEESDPTLLGMLRRWATVTGYELEFDTVNLEVNLVAEVGSDKGVGFYYAHNLKTIKRKYRPPQATRLYAYGANNLTIESSSPGGTLYIEDYSWYTAQGLTITQARALYRKDFVWVDDRYLQAVNLYDAAVLYLAQLAQPSIQYSGSVLNLNRLTDSTLDDYLIGDYVRVEDEILAISVSTRVVRLVRYPQDPKADEIELEFLNKGLVEAQVSGTRDIDYGEIFILVDDNTDIMTINGTESNFAEITLTSTGQVTMVMGATFAGVATGTGSVTFSFVIDGLTIGAANTIPFTNGQQVIFSWPSFASGLEEGSHTIHWRAQVTAGTGTISLPVGYGRAWLLTRGAIGVGINTSPNAFVSEELTTTVVSLTEDWVVEFVSLVDVLVNEAETIVMEDVTITERFIIPFKIGDPVFGVLDGPGALSQPD